MDILIWNKSTLERKIYFDRISLSLPGRILRYNFACYITEPIGLRGEIFSGLSISGIKARKVLLISLS